MGYKYITTKLRKNITPWERKLWQVLRSRGIEDLKFRRQYKIGKYVVDFICLDKHLVIELDGGHHTEKDQTIKDGHRQRFIESQGFKVIRIWNHEIDENLDGVVQYIIDSALPHP